MSLAFEHDSNHSRCDCLGARYGLLAVVVSCCVIFSRSQTLGIVSGHLSYVLYHLLMLLYLNNLYAF